MIELFRIFRKSLVLLLCIGIGGSFFYPQRIDAVIAQTQPNMASSSSFFPVGSGARAMGIGGAFIAIADDATAASWNPGGLIQLKRPQISFVGNLFIRQDQSSFDTYPEASITHKISRTHVNYFSLACPMYFLKRNMIFSLNYQHLYDMNLQYNRTWRYQEIQNSATVDVSTKWDYLKKGGLDALSPALAVEVTPSLAIGLTMNYWPPKLGANHNGWKQDLYIQYEWINDEGVPFQVICQNNDRYTFSGTNFHYGFLWQINSVFTLGGVMKTSFSAKLDHESQTYKIQPDCPLNPYEYETDKKTETLVMPPSYGLGLAARFSDSFTLSLDVYRTEWEKHKLHTDIGTISPITERSIDSSSIKPTHHIRLGLEYLIINPLSIVPLRLGFFYDPDPSENHPDDFYGFSLGTGLALKHIAIDVAYQYRFAEDISTLSFQGESDHCDIKQHLLYLSAIYYW